jgi:hypothetical protein
MVARNFYEDKPAILYPQVDMAGDKTGITGMEFPLLNWLIYLFSLIKGFTHWHGRLINLVISSAGIYFFFLIVRRFFNRSIAFYSALLLLGSIWLTYSRKIMPDTFSVSLVLAGIYFGFTFLDKGKFWRILLFLLFSSLGILSKIPAAILLVVLFMPVFQRSINRNRIIALMITGLLSLVPAIAWYFSWVPYLVEEYGYWHFFMGVPFKQGIKEIFDHFDGVAVKFYFEAFYSYGAFLLFLAGIVIAAVKKELKVLAVLVLTFLAFSLVVFKAGESFSKHCYYVIPFVPVMALTAGYCLDQIKWKWIANIIVFLVIAEGIINQQHDFYLLKQKHLLELESIADKVSGRSDLILINGDYNPVHIYFSHRKGWTMEEEQIFDEGTIENVISKGCKFLILDKNRLKHGSYVLSYEVVYEDKNFRIYQF